MSNNIYKSIASLFFVCSFFLFAQSQSITITSPTPASTLQSCEEYEVKWTNTGTINNVNIDYSFNGGQTWKSLASFITNTGSRYVIVPSLASATNHTLRIRDSYNSSVFATVAGFTIQNSSTNKLRFTGPLNYGQPLVYNSGSGFSLQYNQSEVCVSEIEITLSTNGGVDFNISVTGKINTSNGSYYYTVPAGMNSKNCYFKIQDTGNPANFDVSERFELITPISFFELLPAASGSTYSLCNSISLYYRGTASQNYVIEYSLQGSGVWRSAGSYWGNTSSIAQVYNFAVKSTTGTYITRAYVSGNPSTSILGPSFQVQNGTPSLIITNPTGTQSYTLGQTLGISFQAVCTDIVRLDISSDAGQTWVNYVNNQGNSGYISMTIPTSFSGNYLARVYDVANPTVESIMQFVVIPPSLTVLSTSTGLTCANYNIQWSTKGMSSNTFNLSYSTNGGSTYIPIANNQFVSGAVKNYTWNVPSTLSGAVRLRVMEVNSSISGVRDIAINNYQGNITAVSYDAGNQQPCNYSISWTGTACGYNVYFTPDNGNTLYTLQTNTTGNNLYITEIPTSLTGIAHKVLVRSATHPTVSFLGTNIVTFSGATAITNVFPSSGSYTGNNYVSLSWSRPICKIPNVNVELSTNGGVNFFTVSTNNDNNSYFYLLPNINTNQARVRVTSTIDPTISAIGSNFTITSQVVVSPQIVSITSALNTLTGGNSFNLVVNRNETTNRSTALEISFDNGAIWHRISNPNISGLNPSINFTVPPVATNQAKLRLFYQDMPNVKIVSTTFTIVDNIIFTSIYNIPTAIAKDAAQYIYFNPNSSAIIPYVDVELSTNAGVDFFPLYTKLRNQGNFLYSNAEGYVSADARFRVRNSAKPSVLITSTGFALVNSALITITSAPTTLTSCMNVSLDFRFVDNGQFYFDVDYTDDGGVSWNKLVTNQYLSGFPVYNLQFPAPLVSSDKNVKFRVYQSGLPETLRETGNIFVYANLLGGLSFARPTASDIFTSTNAENIQWLTTGAGCTVKNVKIEYSLDGGSSFTVIRSNVPVSLSPSSLSWFVPGGSNTSTAVLKASSVQYPSISTTSQNFSISDPFLIISVPSLVNYNSSSAYAIIYGGQPTSTYYYRYYSIDGGSTWVYLTGSNISSGSGRTNSNWTTPNVNSFTGALLGLHREYSLSHSNMEIVSSPFTITSPIITMSTPGLGQEIQSSSTLITPVSFTFSGWTSSQTMYPYYILNGNEAGATRITSYSRNFSGSGFDSFTWTLPNVATTTSAIIGWGNNSTSLVGSSRKIYGHQFTLVPPVNNVVTVTATNATFGMCQGRQVVLTFGGSGVYNAGNRYVAEIVSSNASAVGTGYYAGEIASTLTSGVITITTPNVGYSGSWVLRVYSTAPQITNVNNLKFQGITFGSNSCITANNNNALLSIDGIGTLPLAGSIAYQINTTFAGGNQFIAQLSNSIGGFNFPINIGSVSGTTAGSIPVNIPTGLATSSNYQIRVVSTNLPTTSSPTVQFTINNAYIDVWSIAGNNFCPGSNFSTIFDADGDFLTGNQFRVELSNSSGNFPTGTFIGSLSDDMGGIDLVANSTIPSSIANSNFYRVRVQSTNPFSNTSFDRESPYFRTFSSCYNTISASAGPYFAGATLRVNITPNVTFGGGNIYIAQLSDASGSFANPQFVGSVAGTSLATITGVIPALSSAGSNFSVRVVSTNHPSTSSGFFLGIVNPLQITMSPSINASGFCQGAYVKLGNITVSGSPASNNQYVVQMNDNGSTNFFSPYNVFSFNSSATGVISVPGFFIPTSVLGNGFNRSFRIISTSPSATSQNVIGTFGYNSNCYGSIILSSGMFVPNANYTVTYNLNPNLVYASGNQMIAEISGNDFATVLGIGSVVSVSSGVIPVAIPNTLPTGMYKVRVRSTDFASISFSEDVYVSQVNIATGNFDNTKQYCQGGPLEINNFTVSSLVNAGNKYIIQISTSQSFPLGSTFDLTTIASASMGSIPVGTITIPVNSLMGDNFYYYRILSTDPVAAVNHGTQIQIRNNCLFVSNPASSYCPAAAGSVFYGNVSLNAGNRITGLLSDELGNFNNALPIGSVLDNVAGGSKTFNFTIPSGLPQGSGYRIKLVSNDFVSESQSTSAFEIKQVCIGQPGGFNTGISQCSFIPVVTVSAFGTVNPGNEYKLILTYTSGVPVNGVGLNSLLGTVMSASTGVITFENVILPTVTGTYRLRVLATNPAVSGDLGSSFSIINNCLGAPFFPFNKICSGNPFYANVYIGSGNTYNAGNQFIVELSNASGSFGAAAVVSVTSTTSNNFYTVVTIPSNLPTGSGYKLRVRSTNPAFTSNDGNTFAIDQVCLSAGSVAFGPYIGGSSSISIPVETVGNVVNGTTQYSAALYNQFGTFIGNIGTATTATTITGTLPSVSNGGYYYAIITSTNPTATSSQSNLFIVNQTALEISTLAGSYCVGSSVLGVVFTATGSVGGGNQYALDLSDANGNFNFTYYPLGFISDNTVGVKTISGVIPIGITQSANYRLRVRASNGSISLGTPININATFEWTGAVNKDWNNVGNWSCPLLPTSNIDVVIPQIGNGNYPEINVTNAVARNMTVNTLASAFVLDNGLLSVYGNLVINGTFNSNSLGGINFLGAFNTNHDILGSGTVNLGLVTVPSFNYLNIRNTVSRMYRYYNYGYTYNYSVVNNIYEFYNYNRFEAYNNFTVINRFQNDYVFNVYNTFVSNPEFYVGNFFVNNSTFFNPAVSSFYFTGTNSFISGTYAPTFYNFYVNNGVNLSLQNIGINVYANYGNSGFFNGLGYPVSFISGPTNAPTVISGSGFSNFGSVIFNNIYGVNVTNNIAVQNNFLNIAGFNAGTSVISFTGNGIQNVSMAGIGNLTFNGINVAETTSDLGVDANLVVQGSFTNRGRFRNNRATYFEGNAPQVISGSGYSRFNYIYNYNTFGVTILTNIVVDGNLENNGLLNAAGYTISTTGTTAQTISGTNVINLGSLENTNTTGLDITQDVVVQGSFTNRGRVRGRDNTVVFGGDAVQTVVNTGTEAVFTNISVTNTVAAVNLEGSYVVNGNISNDGLLNASNTVITLSGVANQTISGTNEVVLGTVLNENTTGILVTQDVAVTGNFRNRGRFRSTETLTLEGTTAQTISGNSSLELTNVINTNTTELKVETPLVVSGNIANNGVLDASTTVISTTGTAVQSITGSTVELGTLVNTNTVGGVKVEAPVEVKADIINNGSLTIDAPLTFAGTSQTISGTSAPLVQDVTVAPSSTVAVKGSVRSRGRIVNNSASTGIVAAPATTVSFEGTTKQSIEGTTPTAFANIAVQNTSGIDVKQTVSATGVSLAGGNLIVDAGKSVNITSADPNAVVRTNDSYVEGTLTRVVTASGAAYTFPVGTTDAYRGVEVTFTGVNNAGGIAVTPSASAPALTQPAPNGAPLALFDPNLNDTLKAILPVSWKVEAQNPSTPGDYNIALQAPVTLPGYANPAELTVVKRADESSPWVLAGDPAPVQTVTGGVKFSRRNVRSFSEYAVAGTCANVSRVSTKPGIEQIDGTFRSDMEGNNYEWTIDDSVQRVLTTRTITPRKSGRYRVRVIVSGCYSEASEYVEFTAPNGMAEIKLIETLLVYPNPAKGEFTIESETAASGAYVIEMTNSMGNTVFVKTLNFIDANKLKYTHNTESLPTGIYFIKVSNKDKTKVIKLVVQ